MAYYNLEETQRLAAENKDFVLGEHDAGRKAQRLLDYYFRELERTGDSCNKQIRFICVEHQCRLSDIDPFKIVADLKQKGYTLVFDDASISHNENVQKYKKVERYWKTMYQEKEEREN